MKARAYRRTSFLILASLLALALSSCSQFTLYEKFRSIEQPHTATNGETLAITPASALINAGATITFAASGGTTPYQFSVGSGGGTVGATSGVYTAPSTAGAATVTVTDAVGDSATAQVTISTPASGPLTIYPGSVSIASGTTLTFSVSGGTPPYTYAVTAGGGSVSSSGVYQAPTTAGSATVTVTDSAHTTSSANVQIVLAGGGLAINPASATITAGTSLTFSVANGTSPYTYSIVSGGGTIGSTTGLYTAPATAGTAKVRVTDGTSATSDATVTIVPPPLVMSPTAPTVTVTGVIDFAASGGTTPYTYSVNTGGVGGMITSTTGVYTAPTSPGTDTVTVTDASGKTSSATVTVVAASQVVISPATVTVAAGGTYQFGASGGVSPYTYSIYSGSGSVTKGGLYTAPGTASTDTVRVTDSVGSTSDAVVTVTPPALTISPLTTSVIAGGNVTFSATGGTGGYTYSVLSGGAGGSVLSSGVYTAPGVPGTDTVQVKDSSGVTSDAVVTIVSASQLLISPTTVTVGAGQTYQFGATGGTSPYTYSLLSGAGSVSSSGLYTAPAAASTDTVRVTDAGGATSDATVTVTAPVAALAINPTAASVNVGESLSFSASGGSSPYTYSVVGGTASGTINASTGSYTAPLTAGTYTVQVTDSTGATSSASVTVNAVAALAINPASLSLNAGATYQFGVSGGVSPYTYSMYSGSGTVSASGLYTAPSAASTDTVRVTDALGTTSDALVTVAAPAPPLAISPTAPSVTVGGQVTFNVSGGTAPYSYTVLAGGAGGTINSTGVYTAPTSSGTDTVQVTDSLNHTVDATVTVNALPALSIIPATLSLAAGATYQFGASGGDGTYTYSMYSGSGTMSTSGLYTAPATASTDTVQVKDGMGSTAVATVTVAAPLAINPATTTVTEGVTVSFSASGGSGSYSYQVLGGGAGGTVNSTSGVYTAPMAAGTDTVRVTDSVGTTSDATVTVVAASPLVISPATVSLSAGGTQQFGASGGVPPYSYSLFSGSGTVSSSGAYTAPNVASTDIVRVTDSIGLTSNATVTVAAPLAINPVTPTVTEGGTVSFSASGGSGSYSYLVLGGGAGGTVNSTSGLYTAPMAAGTDTVQVTDTYGTTSNATVTVAAASPLVISPATLSLGAGGTQQFGASGGVPPYTYTLFSGSGTVSSSGAYTAPNIASTDTVRVTDSIGLTSDATVTVAAPLAINPVTTTVMEGVTVSFSASGGSGSYSYQVLAGGAGGSINSTSGLYTAPMAAGTDTVRVTDTYGTTADATVTVTVPPALAISPTSVSIVANTTYQFGASGGVAPYTYSVYSGTGTITSGGLYTAPSTVSSATVRVTDSVGETSDSAVTILASLAISPTTTGVLTGGTVNFSATGGIGSYTYSVLTGGAGGTINSGTGAYTAPTTTGTDTVQVTDSGGNTSDATVTIVAGSQLLISPTSLTISVNNTYQFGVSGGTPPYTFSMYSGSGSVTSGGLYTAPASASTDTVRVTDSTGTSSSYATVTVVSGGPLAISPANETVPENGSVTFAGSGGTPPYIFTITSGSGSIGAYSGTYSATGTVGANVATITLTDNAGSSVTATVSVVPLAPTNLTATPSVSHGAVTLAWTDNTGDTNASIEIEKSADDGATYSLLTTVAAGTQTYSDSTGSPNVLYVYRVKAVDSTGTPTLSSAYSNVAFVVK